MSQARVTDFFATRKRNRLDQNEVLLNKQKKTQMLIDSPDVIAGVQRALRSRTKQLEATGEAPKCNPAEEQKPDEAEQPKKGRRPNAAKKEQLEALKARINRLDDKMSKIMPSPEQPAAEVKEDKAEETKAPEEQVKPKKRLNKAELKQKIEQFNKNLLLIQNQAEPEPVKQPEVEMPPPKPVEPEIPAYLKYKDLASEEIDHTSTLTLPKSYAQLLDFFKGSDTIIKFLFNRDEMCTFLKLRMGIQNITKHTFTLKHLGQIKTVYTQAYLYKQEKLFIDFKNDYHLIIAPNMDEIETNPDTGLKQFTPHVLLKRLTKFKSNLFKIVKKYHQEFLESIGIKDIQFDKIKRWHQKFDLENLKEVDESELPKPPNDDSVKCKTGQELLTIAKDIYSSRIQDAIKKTIPKEDSIQLEIINKTSELKVQADGKNSTTSLKSNITTEIVLTSSSLSSKTTTATVTLETTEKPATDQEVLDKLKEKKESTYNALLEKIRNKEKQKQMEKMIMNSDEEKTLVKLKHFKEAVRFLAFFYQAEKKSTLELDMVAKKMSDQFKELSEIQCKELLYEMAGKDATGECILVVNDKKWLNLLNVRKLQYLQLEKSFKLNDLLTLCDKEIEKIQNKNN